MSDSGRGRMALIGHGIAYWERATAVRAVVSEVQA